MKTIIFFIFFPLIMYSQIASDSIRGFWRNNESLIYEYDVFNNSSKEFERLRLTSSENGATQNKIRILTEIFKKNKALNPPMGAAVYFYGEGGSQLELPSRNSPKSFNIALVGNKLFQDCDSCKIHLAGEYDNLLSITVNDISSLLQIAPYKNDINNNPISLYERWFISPKLEERYLGFPAEFTEEADFVYLSKINRSFGISVTHEEYLKEAIRVAKKDYNETEKRFSTSTYESGKKTLDSVENEMNKSITQVEKIDPNAARTMREEFEKSKRETLEKLKASEGDVEKGKQEGLINYRWFISELEKELSSLSDSEKVSPAHYKILREAENDSTKQKIFMMNKDRSERISGLVSKGGFPVIRINPAYYNSALNKTEIQLIVIRIERANRALKPNEYIRNLIDRICEHMDLRLLFNLIR